MRLVNNAVISKKFGWICCVLLLIIIGRFTWLLQTDGLVFESDITALLPALENSQLVEEADNRIATGFNNLITVIVEGKNPVQVDAATDRLADMFSHKIAQGEITATQLGELEPDLFSARIRGMLTYKDRLIGEHSRQRMENSADSQLLWRINQVTRFPPENITDPVVDPLGTLEEFLTERLPRLRGVHSDGVYLRVNSDAPANLLLLKLGEGEPANRKAIDSVRSIIDARDLVAGEFDVKIYLSGIPLHATMIKQQTIQEVRWMAFLALFLTAGIFLYVTKSVRALLVSTMLIFLAVIGGLVISQSTVGLPHLIGLTMAVTAIGICADFSLHFWIHVRTGLSGAAAISKIRSGINMSCLTTIIGLLVVVFTAIPVLSRSAIFISGALLVSWFMVLFIVPMLAGDSNSSRTIRRFHGTFPRKIATGLVLVIACISVVGLSVKYHTDDSPHKLGRRIYSLEQDDRAVRDFLHGNEQAEIYLVRTKSAESLLETESTLLAPLDESELSHVDAVSRLVIPERRQRDNQLLFQQAKENLDADLVRKYLNILQVPALKWQPETDEQYTLQWVQSQPWASIERNRVLVCEQSVCASMMRARGGAAKKLNESCRNTPECSRISLSERQLSAFQNLRYSLIWTIMLATGAVFVVLYIRYRNKAFGLIMVPILASLSGIAATAWAGMPITVFTLAAIFPLLGLSLDYVIFASESSDNSAPTFLAIFASALTTFLSFLILSFSATAAVKFFALPIAVGILVAWISVQVMQSNRV